MARSLDTGEGAALTSHCSGAKSAAFGGALGFAVLFYASGMPRVRKDILQKIPLIGGLFVTEIHPADNVSDRCVALLSAVSNCLASSHFKSRHRWCRVGSVQFSRKRLEGGSLGWQDLDGPLCKRTKQAVNRLFYYISISYMHHRYAFRGMYVLVILLCFPHCCDCAVYCVIIQCEISHAPPTRFLEVPQVRGPIINTGQFCTFKGVAATT